MLCTLFYARESTGELSGVVGSSGSGRSQHHRCALRLSHGQRAADGPGSFGVASVRTGSCRARWVQPVSDPFGRCRERACGHIVWSKPHASIRTPRLVEAGFLLAMRSGDRSFHRSGVPSSGIRSCDDGCSWRLPRSHDEPLALEIGKVFSPSPPRRRLNQAPTSNTLTVPRSRSGGELQAIHDICKASKSAGDLLIGGACRSAQAYDFRRFMRSEAHRAQYVTGFWDS